MKDRFWIIMCILSLIIWINSFVSEGVGRRKRKVRFRHNLTKILCGFPTWIEDADISLVILNLINLFLFLAVIGEPYFQRIEGAEEFYDFFTKGKLALFMLFNWGWLIIVGLLTAKEQKKRAYFRETVDINEKKGKVTVGTNKIPFSYVLSTLKRKGTSTKLIVFLPESYNNITQDADGNISKYDKKEGWKKTHNMGAYEELSDALVRAGYATVRFGREKREHDLPVNFVMKKEIVEAYLENEPFEGEIYLLAHGLGNIELKQLTEGRKINGIISLCGAAAGFWESCVNRGVWMGGNRKRLEKLYQKQMDDAPQEVAFLRTTRSRRVEEFVEIAKAIPIFLGYVEYDPYYDEQLVGEIKSFEEGKIAYHYYQDTDFTLRFRRKNIRKGVRVDGQEMIGLDMPRLNPRIAEEIIEWMNRG